MAEVKPKGIAELPREVALEILTKQEGYSRESAEEILAIARGESKGDREQVSTPAQKGQRMTRKGK